MISASVRIATASSRPNSLLMRSGVSMNAMNTADMMIAAAKTTRPIAADAVSDRVLRVLAVDVLLADPAHQEDLVVHREPEQDRERDRWHEALDRPRAVEPDQVEAVAHLEHEREDAEPDGGRDQRRDRRLERDHDRAERHREHEERDADDVEQEPRRARVDAVADVDEGRVLAAHVGVRLRCRRAPAGTVWSRSVLIRSSVFLSCGFVAGEMTTRPTSLLLL